MNHMRTFAIALPFLLGASLSGAAPEARKPAPAAAKYGNAIADRQVTGKILWSVASNPIDRHVWTPTAADTCAQWTVEAYDHPPATTQKEATALGISTRGYGKWSSGYCRYALAGVPEGTHLELRASYGGAVAQQHHVGTRPHLKAPFLIEKGKVYTDKDVQADFDCHGNPEFPCN
jgi:hypothetical protein